MVWKRVLITGAGGPGAVNMTRSLHQSPKKIFLVGCDSNPYYLFLSLTDEKILVPSWNNEKNYIPALNKIIDEYKIDFLMPNNSVEMEVIARNLSLLNCSTFIPSYSTLITANNKFLTYQTLKNKGLPVPETYLINNYEDLKIVFEKVKTRPVWVRGAGIPGRGIGGAQLPCETIEIASSWIEYYKGWGGFIASEFLNGKNLTWIGLFKEGSLITSQGRERIAYVIPHVSPSGITGAPAVSKTIHRSDINNAGYKAVLSLDDKYNGVAFVDFKCDENDNPKITEINAGRFGTTHYFYTACGVNFPYLLLCLAFDEEIPPFPKFNPIEEEIYWVRNLDCGPVMIKKKDVDLLREKGRI